MSTPQLRIRDVYGFDFPDEFFAFADFLARIDLNLLDSICEMSPAAPFDIAVGRPLRSHPDHPLWESRYYNDLPEFVTVFHGNRYGRHWAYHFDDPGNLPPIVVSYWHRDSVAASIDGGTLFEAIEEAMETLEGAIEVGEGPEDAEELLEQIEELREILEEYDTGPSNQRKERPELGETIQDLGIVVPANWYRPLTARPVTSPDGFTPPCPSREVVEPLIAEARLALVEGFPGTSLELGHNLWPFALKFPECYELLESAYTRLDRLPLVRLLHAARDYRAWCDRGQS